MRKFLARYSWFVISLVLLVTWWLWGYGPPRDREGRRPQDVARKFVEAVRAGDFQDAATYWRTGDIQNVEANWELPFAEFLRTKFQCDSYELSRMRRGKQGLYIVHFRGQQGGKTKMFDLFLDRVGGKWRLVEDKWLEPSFSPVQESRFIIRKCEEIERTILTELKGTPSDNLNRHFASVIAEMQPSEFGTDILSKEEVPLILDGWGHPLEMRLRAALAEMPNVSQGLLRKTNNIVIWSHGKNGMNEYGCGDDVLLSEGKP